MRSTLILFPAALAVLSATRLLQFMVNPTNRQAEKTGTEWPRLITAIANPDLHAVVAFCLIGFLLALNLILRFPDFGAVIEQYNQF
jgi:hypothetical protein